MRKLVVAAAVSLLLTGAAYAQVNAPTLPGVTTEVPHGNAMGFIEFQEAAELLSSDIIGRPVMNLANETLGTVNNLVFDFDGSLTAVVLGVGGFLGIGVKNVAVAFDAIDMTVVDGNIRLVFDGTRDALNAAPAFSTLQDLGLTPRIPAVVPPVDQPVTPAPAPVPDATPAPTTPAPTAPAPANQPPTPTPTTPTPGVNANLTLITPTPGNTTPPVTVTTPPVDLTLLPVPVTPAPADVAVPQVTPVPGDVLPLAALTTPAATDLAQLVPPVVNPSTMPEPTGRGDVLGFVDLQATNEFLATDVLGKAVFNPAGDALGTINNVLLDHDGKLVGVVVGVGGFLGIGTKNVAIAIDAIDMAILDGQLRLVFQADRAALDAAPAFRPTP